MRRADKVPDAWDDDDWEVQADRSSDKDNNDGGARLSEPVPDTKQPVIMKRSERLARHAEEQRKLWEAAEAPPAINYAAINTSTNAAPAPLLATTPFKPAMKLLSRKPAAPRKDTTTGGAAYDDDEDDDEDGSAKSKPTAEEVRLRQQREREERQRRYDEARAKIFGDSNPSSGQSTPGSVTPPSARGEGGGGGGGRQTRGGRAGGRGRGGGGGGGGRARQHENHTSSSNSGSSMNQNTNRSPAPNQQQSATRELYDPNYSPKPGFQLQRRGPENASPQPRRPSTAARDEDQAIRAPRGPDSSGRGGFQFARRGP